MYENLRESEHSISLELSGPMYTALEKARTNAVDFLKGLFTIFFNRSYKKKGLVKSEISKQIILNVFIVENLI